MNRLASSAMNPLRTTKSPRVALRWLWAGALCLGSVAAQAMDDPPGRVGRIADFQGQVWMMEAGQSEWTPAPRNRPFTTGDRLSTERAGRLELQVGSTTVRLDGRSELQVVRLDDDRIELQLVSGSVAVRAREPEVAREIDVITREGHYEPLQPGLYRVDRDGRGSYGAALHGELQFGARDSALLLRTGQRAEFWYEPTDGRTHFDWAPMVSDEFIGWVQRDDARDDQRAAQAPVSPEMTGGYELDRYGQWSSHPEFGAIWTPVGLMADWAPYRYGRWSWISPWGWTWIDDAPWGFAPFHYGRWVFWNGHWCWAPGQRVRRPIYAPAMVAWIGGGSSGVSVSVGVGPSVGWIPLGPREPYFPHYGHTDHYWDRINGAYGHWDRRPEPRPATMYTNRGVPGGVTMVSSQVLTQREPVLVGPRRIDDAAVARLIRQDRVKPVAPPAMDNVRVAPRVAPAPTPSSPRMQDPRMQEPRGQDSRVQDPRQREPRQQEPAAVDSRALEGRVPDAGAPARVDRRSPRDDRWEGPRLAVPPSVGASTEPQGRVEPSVRPMPAPVAPPARVNQDPLPTSRAQWPDRHRDPAPAEVQQPARPPAAVVAPAPRQMEPAPRRVEPSPAPAPAPRKRDDERRDRRTDGPNGGARGLGGRSVD